MTKGDLMPSNDYISQAGGDYHETLEYQMASPMARRQINRYKKECNISDEHMFLLLYKRELDALPKEKRNSADLPGKAMLAMGGLALWNAMLMVMDGRAASSPFIVGVSFAAFVMAIVMYATGMLNSYRRAQSNIQKRLKEMPEVPDMDEWFSEHPAQQDKKTKKRRRK